MSNILKFITIILALNSFGLTELIVYAEKPVTVEEKVSLLVTGLKKIADNPRITVLNIDQSITTQSVVKIHYQDGLNKKAIKELISSEDFIEKVQSRIKQHYGRFKIMVEVNDQKIHFEIGYLTGEFQDSFVIYTIRS